MTWLQVAREVVDTATYAMIDPDTGERVENPELDADGQPVDDGHSILLDLYSASAMVQIHDHLSPDNAARFAAMPVTKAHTVTFQLLNRNH